jgi:hypothetical protein
MQTSSNNNNNNNNTNNNNNQVSEKIVIDGAGKMYPFYDKMDTLNKKAIDIMVCQGTEAAKDYLQSLVKK